MSALAHGAAREPPINEIIGGDWWDARRGADRKRAAERQYESAAVQRARRLLDNSISLERAWAELHRRRHVDVPRATVEALVYELRTHGLAALKRPNCLRRLSDVSTAQLRDLIATLIRLRPKYPTITDDLLLKLGEQL